MSDTGRPWAEGGRAAVRDLPVFPPDVERQPAGGQRAHMKSTAVHIAACALLIYAILYLEIYRTIEYFYYFA